MNRLLWTYQFFHDGEWHGYCLASEVEARIADLETDRARKAEAISDLVDRVEKAEAAFAKADTFIELLKGMYGEGITRLTP